MKWICTYLLLFIFNCGFVIGQSADQNSKRTNFGVGFMKKMTVSEVSFDYAVADNLFLGLNANIHIKSKVYTLIPSIRASYYFNNIFKIPKDNFDVYFGIGASKMFQFYKGENDSFEFYFPVHIGARYFFKEELGFFIEFSPSNKMFDSNILSMGISLKR